VLHLDCEGTIQIENLMNTSPSHTKGSSPGASQDAREFFHNPDLAQYWLSAIVESADDAIISKTLDGIITSWNKGAHNLFGYSEEEAVGQPVLMLMPPDHQNEEPGILARLRQGEKIEHYETVRVRKDGTLLDISLTVSPIRNADGVIIGASKIARDISDRKRSEIALLHALAEAKEAKKEAEHANRLKDDFLSTISHELRTPLISMVGWTAMLRSGQLDEAMAEKGLASIERNAKAQAQLVEDLLDISRIVSGSMRMEMKPLHLAGIIATAVDSIMPAAQAKGIRLRVVSDPGVGSVEGDADRLQQVIWNLLSNAIKFTPTGGRIEIELEQRGGQVEVTVADTGKGIDPTFMPRIFDRFSQEDSSSTRSFGGLGLGLTIVKHLTELHGGTVRVNSEGLGKGASFIVGLPVLGAPAKLLTPQGMPQAKRRESESEFFQELNGLKLLVVDDEIDTCEMLSVAFGEVGASVKIATSGEQALALIEEWPPDMLICDINMPDMDGYQVIRQIRAREGHTQTPLPAIALTALARVEDQVKALAAGYQMHVPKPIELSELFAIVVGLLDMVAEAVK
jgi:PAS domain S-box-containing protein